MSCYLDGAPSADPTGGGGINLDALAEWLERHPEIAEIVVTEVTTTRTISGEGTFSYVA